MVYVVVRFRSNAQHQSKQARQIVENACKQLEDEVFDKMPAYKLYPQRQQQSLSAFLYVFTYLCVSDENSFIEPNKIGNILNINEKYTILVWFQNIVSHQSTLDANKPDVFWSEIDGPVTSTTYCIYV